MRKSEGERIDSGRRGRLDDADDVADSGDAVEKAGQLARQADAAMRGGMAGNDAGMERDAAPGQPLHVRHRRIVVDVRMVVPVLLEDREGPGRRRVAGTAAGDGGDSDQTTVAEDIGALRGEADDDLDRAAAGALGPPDIGAGAEARGLGLDGVSGALVLIGDALDLEDRLARVGRCGEQPGSIGGALLGVRRSGAGGIAGTADVTGEQDDEGRGQGRGRKRQYARKMVSSRHPTPRLDDIL